MPATEGTIEVRFYPELSLVVTRWRGDITDDVTRATYERVYNDPAFRPGFAELADLRGAILAELSAAGVEDVAAMAARAMRGHPSRTAVVVTDKLSFGLTRMYQAFSDASPEAVQIYGDPSEALAWLGVSPEAIAGS